MRESSGNYIYIDIAICKDKDLFLVLEENWDNSYEFSLGDGLSKALNKKVDILQYDTKFDKNENNMNVFYDEYPEYEYVIFHSSIEDNNYPNRPNYFNIFSIN